MWQVLTVESPSEALNAALAEGLIDLGGMAVQEDGPRLRTFLPAPVQGGNDDTQLDELGGRIAVRAARLLTERAGGVPIEVEWSWQPDEDWLARWKAGLGPRRIGDHLLITPSWTLSEIAAASDDIVIVIDPQMAFGTAEHASTRGTLRLLERAVLSRTSHPACRVLDVGTGSGVLAIAADRLGADSVDAVDVDPDAIEVALPNAMRNRAERVRFEHVCVDSAFLVARAGRYDVIAANVLRPVLEPLLPGFRRALRGGGTLIVGGILEDEAAGMCAAAAAAGLEVAREDHEDGWWSALLTVVSPSGHASMSLPSH